MKKYKLIIFDLIDTLADCRGLSDMNTILEKNLGKEIVDKFIDGGNIDKLTSVEEAITKFKTITILSEQQEQLVRQWLEWSDTFLFDDTIETLEYLKEKGYKIALISNSPPTSKDQLADLGIKQYFDEAIFSFELGYRKPEKEIFLSMLDKAGVEASEALMIGDSLKYDINGANAVGIDAILLDRNNIASHNPKITKLLDLQRII